MSGFECAQIENAAGYVLSAVPEGEWEAYAHHLTECEECAAKVDELDCVSGVLFSAVPQLSAPPEIRGRVMDVVRAESELLRATGALADRPARKQRRWSFARLGTLTTGALAATLLALGISAGTLLQSDSAASCSSRAATVGGAASPLAEAELEVCDGSGRLVLTGMQAPPDGRIYELWIDDPADRQGPRPAGLFSVRHGEASVDVGKVHDGQTVLVTHEELPNGSEVPTSMTPIVKASV
ncbi:MAG: anti-sigma factor domain-containing protein [Solirubrobacteraceae bacterium]